MRIRAVSSIGVVLAGVIPVIAGGPIFAVAIGLLGIIGYREFQIMSTAIGAPAQSIGWPIVASIAAVAILSPTMTSLLAIVVVAVGLAFVMALWTTPHSAAVATSSWAYTVAGIMYLGLPIFAAILLRGTSGPVDTDWVGDLASFGALGWEGRPRGLAWLLLVILATWIGDTFAYIGGRSLGRRRLFPRVSPNKTILGAVLGLSGSGLVGIVGVTLFGLGVHPIWGALIGIALGVMGQLGDLTESLLKRAANVKDSGNLIPGHGGVLDRMDALLFAFGGGWILASVVDWFAL